MHYSPNFDQVMREVVRALVRGDTNVQGRLRRVVAPLVVAEHDPGAEHLGVGFALQANEPRGRDRVARYHIECVYVTR